MLRQMGMFISVIALLSSGARAQEENSLTRDEVAVIKKKLIAVFDALGQPPAGYIKEDESFYLPTEAYKAQTAGLFQPLRPSAQRKFGGGSEKKAKKSAEDIGKEYEKKMAAAQAKGDLQEMMRLSEELQKKVGEAQLEAVEAKKEPVEVSIRFNSNPQ